MSDIVLDASAVLALVLEEPGRERVSPVLPNSVISTVNLAEVVTRLAQDGLVSSEIRTLVGGLVVEVAPFDEEQAYLAGELRPLTRHLGLSLGDRACLALGRTLGLPVFTADRSWQGLEVGVEIQVIR